ncbi:MAG: hypothetical protein GX443_19135 [Deltaproteobacteria bacterium]|nr:hypothetical protein [Deltaproteobacteria bacterium]
MNGSIETLKELILRGEFHMFTVAPWEVIVYCRVPENEYATIGDPDIRLAGIWVEDCLAVVDMTSEEPPERTRRDGLLRDMRIDVPWDAVNLYYLAGHSPWDFFSTVHVEGVTLGETVFVLRYPVHA